MYSVPVLKYPAPPKVACDGVFGRNKKNVKSKTVP